VSNKNDEDNAETRSWVLWYIATYLGHTVGFWFGLFQNVRWYFYLPTLLVIALGPHRTAWVHWLSPIWNETLICAVSCRVISSGAPACS
jgi:hypothetical protein